MIAIVHSIYSQPVHAPALDAGLMDNDAERYCTSRHYDILYQTLVTMYIGNLCDTDSGRFHSIGFLEKLFIKIF